MAQYPNHSCYPDTKLTSPCPIDIAPNATLGSDAKYTIFVNHWFDLTGIPNGLPSTWEASALTRLVAHRLQSMLMPGGWYCRIGVRSITVWAMVRLAEWCGWLRHVVCSAHALSDTLYLTSMIYLPLLCVCMYPYQCIYNYWFSADLYVDLLYI